MSTILDDLRETGSGEESLGESAQKREKIDFKMVTFTLANRHYAINILKVKEICKANRFTYVPNAPNFVDGVYNLRGEIITIVNLRKMFHLPELKREKDEVENILILHIQENIIGVIVDTIENVIGVQSRQIQPRHPLFTDIQMKYISGVVDVGGELYVILDVDRILGEEEEAEETPVKEIPKEEKPRDAAKKTKKKGEDEDLDFQFVSDTLKTFLHFYVDATNEAWVRSRLGEWKKLRTKQAKDPQLGSPADAENFLAPFYSPSTETLWGEDYGKEFEDLLWKGDVSSIKAWNPGSGKGSEAYSLCLILRLRYPKARIKVWACDHNLLNISAAPMTVYQKDIIPGYFLKSGFLKEGAAGWQFSPDIKDIILFEYHDILNGTALPELDLIVVRDLLSFFTAPQKEKILVDFKEKLRTGGILVIGSHERVRVSGFTLIHEGNIIAYKKEKE